MKTREGGFWKNIIQSAAAQITPTTLQIRGAIYCDRSSSYDKLLSMANLCTLRNRRLQDMAVLMYKTKNNNDLSEIYCRPFPYDRHQIFIEKQGVRHTKI